MVKFTKALLRTAALLLCICFLALSAYAAGETDYPNSDRGKGMTYREYFEKQRDGYAEYLKELALDNGVIPMTRISYGNDFKAEGLDVIDGVEPSKYITWKCGNIIPYFTEFATLGLLAADPDGSKDIVAGFINWYFENINTAETDKNGVDGTIYDSICFVDPADSSHIITVSKRKLYAYQFANQKDNTYDYDSTDAYAGCFLRVVLEYVKAYGDGEAILDGRRDEIDRIVNAMLATYCDNIDLTGAKPTYMVCYLMDNCEVYDGCKAAAELYGMYGDSEAEKRMNETAKAVNDAIEKHLFNKADGTYYAYCFDNGKNDGTIDWNTFYADATCQLFPVKFGTLAPDTERAIYLYDKFNENYKTETRNWTLLTHGDGFPWASICASAAIMGDVESVLVYTQNMDKRYASRNYVYPMYNGEAGQMLMALTTVLESGSPLLDSYIGGEPAIESETETSQQESNLSEPVSETSKTVTDAGTVLAAAICSAAVIAVGVAAALLIRRKKNQ